MARDALTVQTLPGNGGTSLASGLNVNASNDVMVNANDSHKMLFFFAGSGASGSITAVAGTADPAFNRDRGDTNITVAGTAWSVFTLDTARHVYAGGSILLNFSASMAGTLYAFKLPDTI